MNTTQTIPAFLTLIDLTVDELAADPELDELYAALERDGNGVGAAVVVEVSPDLAAVILARQLVDTLTLEVDEPAAEMSLAERLAAAAADDALIALDEHTVAAPWGLLFALRLHGAAAIVEQVFATSELAAELLPSILELRALRGIHTDLLIDPESEQPVMLFTAERFACYLEQRGRDGVAPTETIEEIAARADEAGFDVDAADTTVPFEAVVALAREDGYALIGAAGAPALVLVAAASC